MMLDFWIKVQTVNVGKCPVNEPGSAGYDCFSNVDYLIPPMQRSIPIGLGFKAAFTPGWVGLLLDRSSMGNKGLTRYAGVIDPNYRDEWKVILFNSNNQWYQISRDQKIIQCVFVPVGLAPIFRVDELDITERNGGFGSTGV
jgi:deoxyuridine 5'-triphosphate nucleotidohydrolase